MYRLLTLVLFLSINLGLFAQTSDYSNTGEDNLLQADNLLDDEIQGQLGNEAKVFQVGNNNVVNIEQVRSEGYNFAKVVQYGNDNFAYVLQDGSGNELVLRQSGNGNEYELVNLANNNDIHVVQLGNDNKIIQELNRSNNLNIELEQIGDGNEIIQVLEGNVEAKNFKIRQEGDGLKIEIRQSSAY